MKAYAIASKSEKGRKKGENELNGDCCTWIEEDHCVVLALADGVGNCANDARAARTTCKLFVEKCSDALHAGKPLDEASLKHFCAEIDPVLRVDQDEACFCAVVWYTDTDQVIWFHVGDTRIYKYNPLDGLTQITTDDHGQAENVKINSKYGKYYTDHGALVPTVGISCSIGDKKLEFHTGSFAFPAGDSIILCSDGMYNSSTFFDDLTVLLANADLKNSITRITTTDDDDNSLLILRRDLSIEETVSINELMSHFEKYQNQMPFNALIDRFSDDLETLLDSSSFEVVVVADIVTFMKEKQLYPDRTRIDRLFNKALGRWRIMPEGEEKQRFNMVCLDLKDILKWVFTH